MNIRQPLLTFLASAFVAAVLSPTALAKEKIESITDLPVRSYPTASAPSQMLEDATAMDALRTQVRIDIEGVLDRYELETQPPSGDSSAC